MSTRNQPTKSAPQKAPESLLLFVLVIAVLVTLASFFLARHPASTIALPLGESTTEKSSQSGR